MVWRFFRMHQDEWSLLYLGIVHFQAPWCTGRGFQTFWLFDPHRFNDVGIMMNVANYLFLCVIGKSEIRICDEWSLLYLGTVHFQAPWILDALAEVSKPFDILIHVGLMILESWWMVPTICCDSSGNLIIRIMTHHVIVLLACNLNIYHLLTTVFRWWCMSVSADYYFSM